MNSIEKCIIERALHEQEIQKRLTRFNDRKMQIQECKVKEVKAANASSENTYSRGDDQSSGNESNTSRNESNISGKEKSQSGNELKTTPPRSGLTWTPTGRIFTYVGLRWICTKKYVETYNNTNDSALPLGKETCTLNIVIRANSSSLSV
nr:hypothetical protein [Tanacetum cinerariifolium]